MEMVLERINCPSLRELINRGFDIPYSTLRNYFSEQRNLPETFFYNLLEISKLDKRKINFEVLDENFGRVKGGKISKRKDGPARN